ncbi:transketolase [Tundrisphaera sp. TA3]|uniref:transketolase n=1 Tax=Tundrisphaera sp. TA3 TaxID=3435775 RepID=UPI003EBF255C
MADPAIRPASRRWRATLRGVRRIFAGPHFRLVPGPDAEPRPPIDARAQSWSDLRHQAVRRLLRMHHESRVGHIGGNLSCLDMLLALHHDVLGPDDRFVLSKGHSAGAYYVTLWTLGRLGDDDLRQFHGEGTRLSGHPPASGIEDVLFATGSLGHGLSLAAGLAMAKRLKGEPGRVFCLMSDGEWDEGSCWEALIFASHQRLSNLAILVDLNGLQGFGTTAEVADLGPLADKFRAFGATTREVDGHSRGAIVAGLDADGQGPVALVGRTIKGKGVSFMEGRMDSHYLAMSDPQYLQALEEVDRLHGYGMARHHA